MKKLMVLAAGLMMAVAANATSYSWQIMMADEGQFYDGMTWFVFNEGNAADYVSMLSSSPNDVAGFQAAIAGNDNVQTGTFQEWYGGWDQGAFSNQGDGAVTLSDTAFAIILSDGYREGSTFYYTTDLDTTAHQAEAGSTPMGGDLYFNASDFSTSTIGAVPEPTSGLLLLIGVAGLALRRRRA